MKIWSSEHVFNHPWENVVKAAMQKYPNPLNPSVVGVDVIDRVIDHEKATIKSHRLLTTNWAMSPWISKIIGGNRTCYASEHSCIDLEKKELSLWSRNLTLKNVLNVDEKLTYSIHPENGEKTLLRQEATITVRNVPLIDHLEAMIVSSINGNAQKGRMAIEFIIKQMNEITDDAKRTVNHTFADRI